MKKFSRKFLSNVQNLSKDIQIKLKSQQSTSLEKLKLNFSKQQITDFVLSKISINAWQDKIERLCERIYI